MKTLIPLLYLLLALRTGLSAQTPGPLMSRFPYVPGDREVPPLDSTWILSQLPRSSFPPQNYILPDELLFSPAEQIWVDQLREGFERVVDGDYQLARNIFASFLEVYPDHLPSQIALADILYSIGEYAPAVEAYRRVLALNPNHFQALNNLAWLFSTSHNPAYLRPAEAQEMVRRAMLIAPQSHHVWSTFAQTLFVQGRFEESLQAAAAAVNLAQRGGAPLEVQVNYLFQLDRIRAAISATSLRN